MDQDYSCRVSRYDYYSSDSQHEVDASTGSSESEEKRKRKV